MAMKKKPGRSKVEVGIPSTEAVFSAGNNNASGSLIANLATQNRAELAYELRARSRATAPRAICSSAVRALSRPRGTMRT